MVRKFWEAKYENDCSVKQEQYLLHSVDDQTFDQCCDYAAR